MKLILTVVVDVDTKQEAADEYKSIEENWIIAAAKLNGKDFHPALVEEEKT